MPYTTSYVDDGRGVHKMGSGIVTGLEIFASDLQESLNEARAPKLRYGLIDFSETTELKVTPEDIRRIVELNRKMVILTTHALVAIVAPTPLPYAMARLWHTISDGLTWKANIFHTRPDAIAWLRKELIFRKGSSSVLEHFPSLHQTP